MATIFGIGTLLFAAVGVVAQLKEALNTVWGVETTNSGGLLQLIRGYVISLACVLSLGFLLLVSLIFTAALAAIGKFVAPYFPEAALQVTGSAVSFSFVAILFAMMFKWLPDTPVDWRDVWLGAALTAVQFEIGKFLIGFYVGKQALELTHGAATSLVMLLIWVYYSAQIVLFGAEFTHDYAKRRGLPGAEPLAHAKVPTGASAIRLACVMPNWSGRDMKAERTRADTRAVSRTAKNNTLSFKTGSPANQWSRRAL